ncbi:MAG: hypothetical protein ACRDNF_16675 [Streptosporangiaceae bacterium]
MRGPVPRALAATALGAGLVAMIYYRNLCYLVATAGALTALYLATRHEQPRLSGSPSGAGSPGASVKAN